MVKHLPEMVNMAYTPKEIKEQNQPCVAGVASGPSYPWGLSISLGTEQLQKLDLPSTAQVGDTIHLFCFAKITSISQRETENENGDASADNRVELQITDVAVEDEDEENEEEDQEEPAPRRTLRSFYEK